MRCTVLAKVKSGHAAKECALAGATMLEVDFHRQCRSSLTQRRVGLTMMLARRCRDGAAAA